MGAYLQTEFEKFHDEIKLKDTEDNQKLREKRDLLIDELKAYFRKKAEEEEIKRITFSSENQGSYSMGIGVKPLEGEDYDIDLMILFDISKDDYSPVKIKEWVYEALDKSNRNVDYKKPCVRVQYHKDGDEYFHVDLALYANSNNDGKTYLSKGKPISIQEEKVWEVAEPKQLKEIINNKYSDIDDRRQMKRVIRYLKRWKDFQFKASGNGRPLGIALTALAYNLFRPEINRNSFDSSVEPNDLLAFKNLVSSVIQQFNWLTNRISVSLPVQPYNDLFERMTDKQHETLKEKLEDLKEALEVAEAEADPHDASKTLINILGDDFPEVAKDKSAQQRNLAFPGKSESA